MTVKYDHKVYWKQLSLIGIIPFMNDLTFFCDPKMGANGWAKNCDHSDGILLIFADNLNR